MDFIKLFIHYIEKSVSWLFLLIVYVYRLTLSPLFGSQCRFHPTCSVYAIEALKTKELHKALFLILKRLSKCNPLHNGGYDPVK